jgi:TolB-like protein/Tfp pilus assembly protein PilF
MQQPASERRDARFGVFHADFRTRELRKQGVPVKLQDKPFRLLEALIQRPGEVVTRDELRRRLWGDQTFVDFERSLNIAITKLRAALCDSAETPRFVETLPRRGYRFIAPVTVDTITADASRPDQNVTTHNGIVVAGRRPILISAVAIASVAIATGAAIGVAKNRASNGPVRVESLAVLPLENLSGDPEQEYLSDGVTDALITELGKTVPRHVISRTSILRYKGARKSLPDIGRELRVDAVVEGSVVRAGNRIRISAQLVHAASDRHLWAQVFERDVHDIVRLYGEVAGAIAREIQAEINHPSAVAVQPQRVDPDAWDLYVRGRYFWARGGADNVTKARDYFQQAIDKQSDYAVAYAGLADAYLLLADSGFLSPVDAIPKAKQAALKALELDESLAEAHTSLGGIACTFEADWAGAERAYKRALQINPNYAIAHQWWGTTLAGLGRHAEADEEVRQALAIDPASVRAGTGAGRALYLARQYTDAIERFKKTLELDHDYALAVIWLGRTYVALNKKEEALAELERAALITNRAPSSLGPLGHAYGVFGYRDKALAILAELQRLSTDAYVSPLNYALVYLGLRDVDRAFQELHRAADQQLSSLGSLRTAIEYDPLRSDPRFIALLHRVNSD